MQIKILGKGCPKCQKLESNTQKAVQNLEIDAQISHEKDIVKIMEYGVMKTPALVVDEKVVSMGKVLDVKDIENLLK